MRLLVVGAGAVGSWIGGHAAAGGVEVTLVSRGEHGRAAAERGLRLEGPKRVTLVKPAVVSSVAGARGPFDVVVVAVKSYDTDAVAAELAASSAVAPRSMSPTRVVSLQNGVGNEGRLASAVPGAVAVAGTITTAVRIEAPAIVASNGKGGVGLAPTGRVGPVDDLVALLTAGGLEARAYGRGSAMKWSKLLLNILGSATTALLRWPPVKVFSDRRLFEVERRSWLEAYRVMSALGLSPVALPGYPVPMYAAAVRFMPPGLLFKLLGGKLARGRGDRMPGVAADLMAGKTRTEIDVLGGAVVAAGRRVGVPTPVNDVLVGLVRDVAAGRIASEDLADRPEALVALAMGRRSDVNDSRAAGRAAA